jgi:hypothetical protein
LGLRRDRSLRGIARREVQADDAGDDQHDGNGLQGACLFVKYNHSEHRNRRRPDRRPNGVNGPYLHFFQCDGHWDEAQAVKHEHPQSGDGASQAVRQLHQDGCCYLKKNRQE